MVCSKCGKKINDSTPASENWEYYCPECGMEEIRKQIAESNKYYGWEIEE